MAWLAAIGSWLARWAPVILRLLGIIGSALGIYFMWQWGSSITTGVQQAAPGIGTMVASFGMLFALLPPMMLMMMFMWMMSTVLKLFIE